jgi:septum formation protein
VAKGGKTLWQDTQIAMLTMWDFDDAVLDAYCASAGPALTKNVGAYALEGRGLQLFESIHGDYFTILGMPLLPLLKTLRQQHGIGL